jgi:protoporphyrinogen oxidase
MSVAIIGSGFAGLAAADALVSAGVDVDVYEQRQHWGGHAHSIERDGFTFDEGPHVSFTKDRNVKELFARGAGAVEHVDARITNYYRGHWLEHPVQCHLHGLDADLVTRCIVDVARAHANSSPVESYADWCRAMFGDTFAEHFPFVYTKKYWTVDAEGLTTDWVGSRIYPPTLEEVVRGALEPAQQGNFHYLSEFRYPREGGYQAFTSALVHPETLHLESRVVGVNLADSCIRLADGSTRAYDDLISTMPLPELVGCVDGTPPEVRRAASELLCTSVILVDVAVRRPDLSSHHWFYVYDEDVSFSRAHFPHMLAASNAPDGHGSIQVEVYHSRHRPLPCAPGSLPSRVIDELLRLRVLSNADDVVWVRHREVPYANVVFDHRRSAALDTILPWVQRAGVILAGRYAEWGYHWTDDATRSGWKAAERVLERNA